MNIQKKYLILLVIFLVFINCSSDQQLKEKPIGNALIDGITKDGNKYDVNIWQAPEPNRGEIVISLPPDTKIEIYSIKIVDEIPWFDIGTETGQRGSVSILHLKNIKVQADYLKNLAIDYDRIQALSMLPNKLLNRKKIQADK